MNRFLALVVLLIAGFAPAMLGSNRPVAWAVNAVAVGACGMLAGAGLLRRDCNLPDLRSNLVVPGVSLWCLALGWALIQALPLPGFGVDQPAWLIASEVLGTNLAPHVSLNPAATLQSILRLATALLLCLAAFAVGREEENAALMLRGLVFVGAAYAFYGLWRVADGSERILWFEVSGSRSLTASFINRNSAATYFGLMACVAFALAMREARRLAASLQGKASRLEKREVLVAGLSGRFGIDLALLVLHVTALLLTQSRAGIVATAAALLAGALVLALRRHRPDGGLPRLFLPGLVAASVLAVATLSGGAVVRRLAATDISGDLRLAIYRDSLPALSDYALPGAGLGAFPDLHPSYRSDIGRIGTLVDKAHNDYLEAMLGLGLPAAAALLAGVALLALHCLAGVLRRRRQQHVPLIAVMATILVALHGFFDFSLQIQAVTLTFATLLGAGVAQSISSRS